MCERERGGGKSQTVFVSFLFFFLWIVKKPGQTGGGFWDSLKSSLEGAKLKPKPVQHSHSA